MKVDLVTIFPQYFEVLDISLTGKARASGLLDIDVHDLRQWAHDRHRTVDDTPYGGGAGMVMKPGPWGEAFDDLGLDGATVVVPTPSGEPFTQALAAELAQRERLIVSCGRYEGIDQRVLDYAGSRTEVREISLGDFVLNGGEVAALAMLEAITRLIPGFMGNPDSLLEESHEAGLLEYPSYTKPALWRDHHVPEILMSGNHAAIAGWRESQARERTVARRPDLLAQGSLASYDFRTVAAADLGELWTLQLACIPELDEDLEDVRRWASAGTTLVARSGTRLVGAGCGQLDHDQFSIGRLMVAPDHQGTGLGRELVQRLEALVPESARY